MPRGRPRIRTPEYWVEYRRRKAREHYYSRLEEAARAKVERGCDACGYNEHPEPLRFVYRGTAKEDPKPQLLCMNCITQIGPVLNFETLSPRLRDYMLRQKVVGEQ